MYAQALAAQGGGEAHAGAEAGARSEPKGGAGDEKVVDAEYTEVKDRK